MNRTSRLRFIVYASLSLLIPGTVANAKDIPLKEVPKRVLDAALKAVPGIEIFNAEKEREWGRLVYELSGVSAKDGFYYEVELTRKGKVIEIEKTSKPEEEEEEADDEED